MNAANSVLVRSDCHINLELTGSVRILIGRARRVKQDREDVCNGIGFFHRLLLFFEIKSHVQANTSGTQIKKGGSGIGMTKERK
jgi:hypothetical protein